MFADIFYYSLSLIDNKKKTAQPRKPVKARQQYGMGQRTSKPDGLVDNRPHLEEMLAAILSSSDTSL
jgi:hypothetical protein